MKITDTEKDLVLYDTKTFLTLGPGRTEIEFGDESKGEVLYVTLDFVNDETNETKLDWDYSDDTRARAILTNWNDPLGITLTEPMVGGTLFECEMVFTFSVRKVGRVGETREVTFSVYLGKEADNG